MFCQSPGNLPVKKKKEQEGEGRKEWTDKEGEGGREGRRGIGARLTVVV